MLSTNGRTDLPGWRDTLIGYYDRMERLTERLLRAFALALDIPRITSSASTESR